MIDGRNFLLQPIKHELKTDDIIKNIETNHGDDYTSGFFLDYPYFKIYYKVIAIDLSKQKKLVPDPKAVQQIHFTGHLDRAESETVFSFI